MLKSVNQAGIEQQPIKATRFCAVLAGIEAAATAQHDLFLLGEGRIKGDAGRLLDYQRQIGAIDRVHDNRRFDLKLSVRVNAL